MSMNKKFSGKKYSLVFILLLIILTGVFGFSNSVLAVGDPASITINKQPASTKSVDFILSQQPTLLVRDSENNPVPDVTVVAFTNGKGNLSGDLAEVTNSNGLAIFKSLRYSGTDDFTIVFGSGGGSITSSSIKLSPGLASSANSLISITPASVVSNGEAVTTVKVYCKDKYKNIIPDAKIGVLASGSDNNFSQPDLADNPGTVTVTLSSTKSEQKIVSVTVNGVSIGDSDPINFVPGKIAKLLISADSPIDTNHTSKIIITGKDKFNNVVTNDSVTSLSLSVDNGGSLSFALVTLIKGIASTTLSKNVPGSVNFTASTGNTNATTQIVFTSSDNVSPEILSQYPSGFATDVAINIMPRIDFSKTMDVTTLTTDNVQLRKLSDDSVIIADVLISNGQKRMILQPISNLDVSTKYYIYVSTGVKDTAGNALEYLYKGSFFTTASDPTILLSNQNADINIEKVDVPSGKQNSSSDINNYVNPVSSQSTDSNNSSGEIEANSLSIDNATDKPKSESLTGNLLDYAQAGFLGAFKNFNISKFGGWFMSNLIWIILLVIIAVLGYIFWKRYLQ